MDSGEKREFLSEQLISYLGNKRSLLAPIERAICEIKAELGQGKISFADVFSGSGIVARLAKAHSNLVIANDLEGYSRAINSCYLSNFSDELWRDLSELHAEILRNFTDFASRSVKSRKNFAIFSPRRCLAKRASTQTRAAFLRAFTRTKRAWASSAAAAKTRWLA